MPIYDLKCIGCGYKATTIKSYSEKVTCPVCGDCMITVPSISGYRRDKTVHP